MHSKKLNYLSLNGQEQSKSISVSESLKSGNIINLSTYNLNQGERDLLDLGLSFIPSVRYTKLEDIENSLATLKRNLLLRDYFSDCPSNYDPRDFEKLFKPKSKWQPKLMHITDETKLLINALERKTRCLINRFKLQNKFHISKNALKEKSFRSNLTHGQRAAIKSLRNNKEIVIKPADKGGKICVIDQEAYIKEGERQLSNTKYYRQIQEIPKKITCVEINKILYRLKKFNFLHQKQYSYLAAKTTDTDRSFYLLPKVHKPFDRWPNPSMPEGRPIVGDCGTEARRVSELITYYIAPLAKKHIAYTKDTYHFLEKIRGAELMPGSLLVTGDITALYTNMDTERTLRSVAEAFRTNPDPKRPDREILQLLKLTLNNNFFTFNNKNYLQILGMGMGKTYAPNCADIYMLEFDQGAMEGYHIKPNHYNRFLDDTFFEWTGSVEQLVEYQTYLNSLIPNIKITLHWHESEVNFLDTTVFRYMDTLTGIQTMQTKVYFKETDTHQLLHTSSFHPKHTTTGILKSQLLRFKRISSFKTDYNKTCFILFNVLRNRGYNITNLHKWRKRIWKGPNPRRTETSRGQILPVVLPYSPISKEFYEMWRGTIVEHGFGVTYRPLAAYRKQRNLGDILTSSRLPIDKRKTIYLSDIAALLDPANEVTEGMCG